MIEYLPAALVAILIGLAWGISVRVIVEHEEAKERASLPYLVLMRIWEAAKWPFAALAGVLIDKTTRRT